MVETRRRVWGLSRCGAMLDMQMTDLKSGDFEKQNKTRSEHKDSFWKVNENMEISYILSDIVTRLTRA